MKLQVLPVLVFMSPVVRYLALRPTLPRDRGRNGSAGVVAYVGIVGGVVREKVVEMLKTILIPVAVCVWVEGVRADGRLKRGCQTVVVGIGVPPSRVVIIIAGGVVVVGDVIVVRNGRVVVVAPRRRRLGCSAQCMTGGLSPTAPTRPKGEFLSVSSESRPPPRPGHCARDPRCASELELQPTADARQQRRPPRRRTRQLTGTPGRTAAPRGVPRAFVGPTFGLPRRPAGSSTAAAEAGPCQ